MVQSIEFSDIRDRFLVDDNGTAVALLVFLLGVPVVFFFFGIAALVAETVVVDFFLVAVLVDKGGAFIFEVVSRLTTWLFLVRPDAVSLTGAGSLTGTFENWLL
eukprot:CAMPEP_0170881258 /NCGR_PEP_ID=MMETSP0734-20130129/32941_1 /TAXON_ID=186038 /ORGANISM="Fragilariopsis kerguelensis, Strain L26-C5" /LENGTH=103 /DNA_ID=CAMNT_0011264973 /DNA_START=535 /DNA_END=846 /DNA_ORIENTATION=-